MKKIAFAAIMLGLVSAPAQAVVAAPGGIPSRLFGGASAQQASYGHYGHGHHDMRHHFRHASRHHQAHLADWRASVPADGDSFMANASYYGGGPRRFEPNSLTASGERFDQWGLTAAHRTLPLGTRLLVSREGRSVVVRVNDRGPAAWTGRSLDLSRGAASAIGLISSGAGAVRVTVLGRG